MSDQTAHPLRAYRERNKIPLGDFARLVGLSSAQLSKIENGLSDPSFRALRRIVLATGREVSADMLIDAAPPCEAA